MSSGKQPNFKPTRRSSEKATLTSTDFALGVLCSMLVSVLLWVVSAVFGSPLSRAEALDLLPTTMSLLVASISTYFSYHALKEQRRSRQAGTDPVVLVHLGKREDAPTMIMLDVSNVGAGAAMNVTLHFNEADTHLLFEQEKTLTDLSKLNTPIRVIPQDSRVSFNLHSGLQLFAEPRLPVLRVGVSYSDVDGGSYYDNQILDISELEQQSAHKAPIASIANSIEKMEKSMSKIGQSNNPLRVISQTKAAHQEEEQKTIDAYRAKRAESEKE